MTNREDGYSACSIIIGLIAGTRRDARAQETSGAW